LATGRVERRLAAILAADVAGYSRLMGADEEGTYLRLKAHFGQLVYPKINNHGGRIVKNTGDGLLAEFPSVLGVVRCAVEIQRGMIPISLSSSQFLPIGLWFAGGGNNMKKGELRAAISRGYREMSELTKVKCGGDKCPGVGNRAYRCCDRMHCQMTIDHAYKDWGIRLPTTGHQLPLMGPTGCTALPHLRPWCTLHQCQIQETGSTKDRGWDAKYFRLRNKLTRLEQQLAAM
jgi:hypothetical protein